MREFEPPIDFSTSITTSSAAKAFTTIACPRSSSASAPPGIAEKSEGAICVFFRDIPELADKPCMIRKSDGGFNYATTDLATVDYRVKELGADAIWYVVGAPQRLHFKQIFAIARREGYTADFRHITFGSILGEDRKLMKTRSGENVALRDVLDEAVERARKIVEGKNPDLGAEEKSAIAKTIGIGAVKYADLSQYRMTDYIFSWDRMLSFQGNTAPYLQNAYVRIRSIFRKLDAAFSLPNELVLTEPAELNLAKRLAQFAETVPQVLNDFRPNLLANYLFELANAFHAFYEACPVLKAEEPARATRLALCELTARVLATRPRSPRDRGSGEDVDASFCEARHEAIDEQRRPQPSRLPEGDVYNISTGVPSARLCFMSASARLASSSAWGAVCGRTCAAAASARSARASSRVLAVTLRSSRSWKRCAASGAAARR